MIVYAPAFCCLLGDCFVSGLRCTVELDKGLNFVCQRRWINLLIQQRPSLSADADQEQQLDEEHFRSMFVISHFISFLLK